MNGKYFESDYEEAFVELLQEQGWIYNYGGELHRKYTDTILEDDLRNYICSRYGDKGLEKYDINLLVSRIRNVGGTNDYDSLVTTYKLYHDGIDYSFIDANKEVFHFNYIDFEHPDNNIYRCVNQLEVKEGSADRIPDIVLFVNGIPVCIVELKSPTDEGATIRDAHTQLTVRYRRDIFSLLKYCCLAVISDASNSRLGTIFTPYEFYYAWKKVNNEDNAGKGVEEMKTLIEGALSPKRILSIINDYVYFPDNGGKNGETEIVCRYPQFFGARMLRDNILKHLRSNGGDGKGGTYFGATGCGKTYTMLFLAKQLAQRCKKELNSPTIVIIVDREDLEDQAIEDFSNATYYMQDKNIMSFESRAELANKMSSVKSGGLYITTIQKFEESTGLLSNRSNIICFSDEAHRSQLNLGSTYKVNKNDKDDKNKSGVFFSYGFAKYLRDALPNATYVGFTGTPIEETVHVFGGIVDSYTMTQSKKDKITVPIYYEARLARVFLDTEKAKQIEEYYKLCADEGAKEEDINRSKSAMSSMNVILGDPERLKRMAVDIVEQYTKSCNEKPEIVQKAMIVCSNRKIAYDLYNFIKDIKPEWCEKRKALDESKFTNDELEDLKEVAFLNAIATRGKDDPKDMFNLLGNKKYRKDLALEFKDDKSNFHIAIVVDMWITGFDVPSLTYMYNDKPLQTHSLIQTISRVNRKYPGKEYGLIVDYLGIRENMKKAMKMYDGDDEMAVDDTKAAKAIFDNELDIVKSLMNKFDFTPFFGNNPLKRLQCLQDAAEYILSQPNVKVAGDVKGLKKDKDKVLTFEKLYKNHVKKLKTAYSILNPAGLLKEDEAGWAQCFFGIESFLSKITDSSHDTESMNKHVEKMVQEALQFGGVEEILSTDVKEDVFSEKFTKELEDVKLPFTKFQLLVRMLKRVLQDYSKTNKIKSQEFLQMLEKVVEKYNTRDDITFVNKVMKGVVNGVSNEVNKKINDLNGQLVDILKKVYKDKKSFKDFGITFEEKAFYDVLAAVRDKNHFDYSDEKCIDLAKKIKTLIENSSVYADWINNSNITAQLNYDMIVLLDENGYPPQWSDDVFNEIMDHVKNYKKNNSMTDSSQSSSYELHKYPSFEDDSMEMAAEP